MQVNVGWGDDPDIAKDQPVVSPRGVVGKTGTVSRDVTDVILMVDRNCSITAKVDGTQDQGIVKGQGNFEQGGSRILMEYLPKNSTIATGQVHRHQRPQPELPRRPQDRPGHRSPAAQQRLSHLRHVPRGRDRAHRESQPARRALHCARPQAARARWFRLDRHQRPAGQQHARRNPIDNTSVGAGH